MSMPGGGWLCRRGVWWRLLRVPGNFLRWWTMLSEISAHKESVNRRALLAKRRFAEKYEAVGPR